VDILPRVALDAGGAGEARATRVIVPLFLLGICEDFVGGLNPRESLAGLDLAARVSVGVVFEGCEPYRSRLDRRRIRRLDDGSWKEELTKFSVLLLDRLCVD
jgi:hypothetical protein